MHWLSFTLGVISGIALLLTVWLAIHLDTERRISRLEFFKPD